MKFVTKKIPGQKNKHEEYLGEMKNLDVVKGYMSCMEKRKASHRDMQLCNENF